MGADAQARASARPDAPSLVSLLVHSMPCVGIHGLHRLREQIYEAEKSLSAHERSERLHRETAAYLRRTGLKLKRVTSSAHTVQD